MTDVDVAKKLHSTTDAQVWAEEFCAMFKVQKPTPYGNGAQVMSDSEAIGLMIGWFANAIETGRTAGYSEGQRTPRPTGGCTVVEL